MLLPTKLTSLDASYPTVAHLGRYQNYTLPWNGAEAVPVDTCSVGFLDSRLGRSAITLWYRGLLGVDSLRSLAATLSFFISGAATTLLIHGSNLPSNSDFDWTVGDHGMRLLFLKAFCILISTILHTVVSFQPQLY